MEIDVVDKNNLSLSLLNNLFIGESKRLANEFNDIHEEHRKLYSLKEDGFLWDGKFYLPKELTRMVSSKQTRKVLHISLWETFRNHLKDQEKVNTDRTMFRQIINNLLDNTNSIQDIRDSLPECFIKFTPNEIRSLKRINKSGFLLTDLRHKKQFEFYYEDMQFYALTSMVY